MRAYINFPMSPANKDARLEHFFSNPVATLEAQTLDAVPAVIAEAEARSRSGAWVVGFVAYEAAPAFAEGSATKVADAQLPYAYFMVFWEPCARFEALGYTCAPWLPSEEEADVQRNMQRIREDILDGSYYQINYTTRIQSWMTGDRFGLFRALQQSQPKGYCLFLETAKWSVLSVSPELFFTWAPGGVLQTKPMKGTAARGASPDEDALAARTLRESEKECAENLMIVDLLRNDLSRVAQTGTVRVPALFELEALPTVWQMTTTVECAPRPEITLTDVFQALFPCGSITGAPKLSAMGAITEYEASPRGAYCGAIGVLQPGGATTFNVGIRTVVVEESGYANCGVGSGVTLLSQGTAEYQEWLLKSRFLEPTGPLELLTTMRLENGNLPFKEAHSRRLLQAAEKHGIPLCPQELEATLGALVSAWPGGDWTARLQVARNGKLSSQVLPFQAFALKPYCLAQHAVDSSYPGLRTKTAQRAFYQALEQPFPGKEVLLFNEAGHLTEFTRGNLVLKLGARLVTPPASCGLLPGIFRQSLLDQGVLEEQVLAIESLNVASEVWLINSVRGWQRVAA